MIGFMYIPAYTRIFKELNSIVVLPAGLSYGNFKGDYV